MAVKFDAATPAVILCVKTSSDQFSGKLSYLKVVGGSLHADSELFNLTEKKKEKKDYKKSDI